MNVLLIMVDEWRHDTLELKNMAVHPAFAKQREQLRAL